MSLAVWQATITDEAGNVIPSASITVRHETSGSPLAVLYLDRAGTILAGNPVVADANGFIRFFTAGGAYKITAVFGEFSREWRYVAIGLAAEADGVAPGIGFLFDSATEDADPPSGYFRFNSATPLSATQLFISGSDRAGNDVSAWLDIFDDTGSSSNRGILIIKSSADDVVWTGTVTGTIIDGGTYRKVTIAPMASSEATLFVAGAVFGITFTVAGADGEVLGPGATVVAGQLVQFSSALGTTIDGAVVSEGSPTDPLVSGTVAGIRAAIPGHVVEAGHLRTASVEVTLSDGADVTVDWESGINFALTMAGNRNLLTPVNGIPGTWRTVYISGNDATARTITFPSTWAGNPPTITDVTSTKTYLLMLYCRSQTQFVVASIEASP